MIIDNGVNIHLSESMIDAIRARGGEVNASAIKYIICKWHGLINTGEQELAVKFTEKELDLIIGTIAKQTRQDNLTYTEFWGLSAERLAMMINLEEGAEKLAVQCLGLSELGALALKEHISGVVALKTGLGGRPRKK